jgi:hypothetical protein
MSQDPVLKEWLDADDNEDPTEDYKELNTAAPNNSKKDTHREQLTLYISEQYVG